MNPMNFQSESEHDTAGFARKQAQEAEANDVFMLRGPMGAGKSVFCRNFIRTRVGSKIDVPSPTFTLVQTYDTDDGLIWHFDLYRLEEPEEIYEIGWEEALSGGIVLVEWPERLAHLMPKIYKEIVFKYLKDESRQIEIKHHNESRL